MILFKKHKKKIYANTPWILNSPNIAWIWWPHIFYQIKAELQMLKLRKSQMFFFPQLVLS